jgi:Fur family transcriptional regulator, ferric uptake regulator
MHHARATLKEQGYRLTPQRTAVWETLRGAGRHMTAEEVAGATRARLPDINTSTVYRTLELLVSLDLVTETKLGSARSYFEVSPDPGHHHFVCERCGSVGHFGDDLFAPLYEALAAGDGFASTRARATVFGVCRECREASGAPASTPADAVKAAEPAQERAAGPDDGRAAPGRS